MVRLRNICLFIILLTMMTIILLHRFLYAIQIRIQSKYYTVTIFHLYKRDNPTERSHSEIERYTLACV